MCHSRAVNYVAQCIRIYDRKENESYLFFVLFSIWNENIYYVYECVCFHTNINCVSVCAVWYTIYFWFKRTNKILYNVYSYVVTNLFVWQISLVTNLFFPNFGYYMYWQIWMKILILVQSYFIFIFFFCEKGKIYSDRSLFWLFYKVINFFVFWLSFSFVVTFQNMSHALIRMSLII